MQYLINRHASYSNVYMQLLNHSCLIYYRLECLTVLLQSSIQALISSTNKCEADAHAYHLASNSGYNYSYRCRVPFLLMVPAKLMLVGDRLISIDLINSYNSIVYNTIYTILLCTAGGWVWYACCYGNTSYRFIIIMLLPAHLVLTLITCRRAL